MWMPSICLVPSNLDTILSKSYITCATEHTHSRAHTHSPNNEKKEPIKEIWKIKRESKQQ